MVNVNEYRDVINELIALERELRRVKTSHSLGKMQTSEAKARSRELEYAIRTKAEQLPHGEKERFLHRRESPFYGRR